MIMMLYYDPSPSNAFSSTQYIFQNVYHGTFLETVHLYTAYAMIMLAFMHMMRGYFVSVHKKPREVMWIVGMLMGFVTLGFGFTGYLLPWTVVSKSATDVGIGMIDALPTQLSSFISFLIVGAGGDATELLRFYDLHVVVLPAVLLVLLTVKMYMLETHGIAEPVAGSPIQGRTVQELPIFPDVTLYLLGLAAMFGSAMLLISVIFPLHLPPAYSPQLAAQYIPQPDWYFLWIYQMLKISIFEGPALPIALGLVTIVFAALFLLPFIDKGAYRRISGRPRFVTVGMIFISEILVLAYWGLITPGQIISTEAAALVLGGTAILVAVISLAGFWLLSFGRKRTPASGKNRIPGSSRIWIGLAFISIIAIGALSIGVSLENTVTLILGGGNSLTLISLALSVTLLGLAALGTVYFLYRLELAAGSLKRRIRWFEMGWRTYDTQ
jgi:quinol-cytochrome oxidoreductase complex cytochrome b subunit